MTAICINYQYLSSAVKQSQDLRHKLQNYSNEIRVSVLNSCLPYTGGSNAAYVSTATTLAKQKIEQTNAKITKLTNLEYRINNFISFAENKDKHVASMFDTLAMMMLGPANWYHSIFNHFYDFFCVDLINCNDVIRNIVDRGKQIITVAKGYIGKAIDWFRYGDGKYILNIGKAVVGTIAAIGGAIAAVFSIPVTGGLTLPVVLACISAAAASVGAVITTINAVATVGSNTAAIASSGNLLDNYDGDPSCARYYGDVSSVNSYIQKKDFGDQKNNSIMGFFGNTIDTIETVADIVEFGAKVAKLGVVKDFRGKKPETSINSRVNKDSFFEGYSFSKENILRNIKHEMGFKKNKLNSKSFDVSESLLAKKYNQNKFTVYLPDGKKELPKPLVNLFRGAKATKNVINTIEGAVDVSDFLTYRDDGSNFKKTWDAWKSISKFAGNAPVFSPIDSYITKFFDITNSTIDLVTK